MKKIFLTTIFIFISLLSFAQITTLAGEGFEGSTFPPAGWAVFDNGVNAVPPVNWATNTIANSGVKAAYMNRPGNIGANSIAKDFLSTPAVTVPANGELKFFMKNILPTVQVTKYQVRIKLVSAGAQNIPAGYNLVVQYTDIDLAAYNAYEQKVVPIPAAYTGVPVYIAFCCEVTQPFATSVGNRWWVDDVNIVSSCLTPAGSSLNAVASATTSTINWNATAGTTSYDIENVPDDTIFTGIPTGNSLTNSYVQTGLLPNSVYLYKIRSNCGVNNYGLWTNTYTGYRTTLSAPTCGGIFADNGGVVGNYTNGVNETTTILPAAAGSFVTVSFTAFNTKLKHTLKIFDGLTNGVLLGTYSGDVLPQTFTSSDVSGALTFVFQSNSSEPSSSGWIADVTCGSISGIKIVQKPIYIQNGRLTDNRFVDLGTLNLEFHSYNEGYGAINFSRFERNNQKSLQLGVYNWSVLNPTLNRTASFLQEVSLAPILQDKRAAFLSQGISSNFAWMQSATAYVGESRNNTSEEAVNSFALNPLGGKVGINLGVTTVPTAQFHNKGSVRLENLDPLVTPVNVLVSDIAGNLTSRPIGSLIPTPANDNIYNADGAITTPGIQRTLDLNTKGLRFISTPSTTSVDFSANGAITSRVFNVSTGQDNVAPNLSRFGVINYSASGRGVTFGANTNSSWFQSNLAGEPSAAFRLTLNPLGGFVGINTTTPTEQFHSKGTLRFEDLGTNLVNLKYLTTDTTGRVTTRELVNQLSINPSTNVLTSAINGQSSSITLPTAPATTNQLNLSNTNLLTSTVNGVVSNQVNLAAIIPAPTNNNIYNINGNLTGPRNLNLNNNFLSFSSSTFGTTAPNPFSTSILFAPSGINGSPLMSVATSEQSVKPNLGVSGLLRLSVNRKGAIHGTDENTSWMQSWQGYKSDRYSYPMAINPLGGNVGINLGVGGNATAQFHNFGSVRLQNLDPFIEPVDFLVADMEGNVSNVSIATTLANANQNIYNSDGVIAPTTGNNRFIDLANNNLNFRDESITSILSPNKFVAQSDSFSSLKMINRPNYQNPNLIGFGMSNISDGTTGIALTNGLDNTSTWIQSSLANEQKFTYKPSDEIPFFFKPLAFPLLLNPRKGNVGIGVMTPTAQLHTIDSVRFEGLPTQTNPIGLLGTDVNGNVFNYDPATYTNNNTSISNTLSSNGNTMTSVVNTSSSTAQIINSISNTLLPNNQFTTTVNNITSLPVNIPQILQPIYVDNNLGTNLEPVDPLISGFYINKNSNTSVGYSAINPNTTSSYSSAFLSAGVNASDIYADNTFIAHFGPQYAVPTYRGKGALLSDRELIVGTFGQGEVINFVAGNSYASPISRFKISASNISSTNYPNTRNDFVANSPLNFIYTDTAGTFLSAPISSILNAVPTSNTLTNPVNTITSTVNGAVASTTAVNTVGLSVAGGNLLTLVNGVSGSIPLTSIVTPTSNTLISTTPNTITSTVNGVAASTTAVNTVGLSVAGGNLLTLVNGVSGSIPLTSIVTPTSNNLSLSPYTVTTGNVLTSTVNGQLSTVNLSTVTPASNNLTVSPTGLVTSNVNNAISSFQLTPSLQLNGNILTSIVNGASVNTVDLSGLTTPSVNIYNSSNNLLANRTVGMDGNTLDFNFGTVNSLAPNQVNINPTNNTSNFSVNVERNDAPNFNLLGHSTIRTRNSFLTTGFNQDYFWTQASRVFGQNQSRIAANYMINPEGGKVAIGTRNINLSTACPDCNDYRLFVAQGIRTEKVRVDIASVKGWADFVFEKDYKLMPLNELELFIASNKHLPTVPTAEEVVNNGLDLAQMNSKLLEKVEELTLYTININKKNIELEKAKVKQDEVILSLIERLEQLENKTK